MLLLLITMAVGLPAVLALTQHQRVAVIGTTGQLGREAIQLLSQQGIATRCLLRHDISSAPSSNNNNNNKPTATSTSAHVAAYLAKLPGVELVPGDINDPASLERLLRGTTACLALHGPVAPRPWFRSVLLPQLLFPESDPAHPQQLNYVGVRNLLQAMQNSEKCKHLVRVSGKGESPWSIFSILLNVLGGMAKGWNYEGEQLIRTTMASDTSLSYTIIRPGRLQQATTTTTTSSDTTATTTTTPLLLGYRDNGLDLPVSMVSYQQLAALVTTTCLTRENFQRATVTAMNVVDTTTSSSSSSEYYYMSVEDVRPDTRLFPATLIAEHKRAARVGGLTFLGVSSVMTLLFANLVASLVKRLM